MIDLVFKEILFQRKLQHKKIYAYNIQIIISKKVQIWSKHFKETGKKLNLNMIVLTEEDWQTIRPLMKKLK